jgi:hypothetical protein
MEEDDNNRGETEGPKLLLVGQSPRVGVEVARMGAGIVRPARV